MSRRVTGPAATLIAIAIGFGWNVTAGATRALAQSPTLERIDRLAGAGRVDEARASLVEWWSSERTSGSRVDEQRGLWLRARLTVDPEQAMLDYRRLVLLYPAGPFTDQALLRLAQAAHALGDDAGARAHVAALVRDHPNGPSRRAAEAWLATAGEPSTPAAVSGAAPGAEPGRAEPRRATGVEPERPPSAPGPVLRASTAEVPSPGSVGTYSVQLGAFGDPARARDVQERAVAAGLDARIVRVEGSDLLHVRLGSFAERPPAQEILDRITRLEIDGAVVRDPRPEHALGSP